MLGRSELCQRSGQGPPRDAQWIYPLVRDQVTSKSSGCLAMMRMPILSGWLGWQKQRDALMHSCFPLR